ncbi:MAG: ABC transporter permease, partial [Deltaproteobacteria bacterium]|nr:ABC transporter permease [Deltaproteobacteria bacterium]
MNSPLLQPVIMVLIFIITAVLLAVLLGYGFTKVINRFFRKFIDNRFELLCGWRFLASGGEKHNRLTFQSFISLVGVSVGVWAMIVVLSVMGGFEKELRDRILSNTPHILVEKGNEPFSLPEDTEKYLKGVPEIKSLAPYIDGDVMLASPTNMGIGVTLKGIDPNGDFARGELSGEIVKGGVEMISNPLLLLSDRELGLKTASESGESGDQEDDGEEAAGMKRKMRGVVIGQELANSLQVTTGDEIQAILPMGEAGPLGLQPKSRIFHVAGIFNSGMYEYDLKYAYISLAEAAGFFNFETGTNKVEIKLRDLKKTDEILSMVREKTPDAGGISVKPWYDLNRNLFSALKLEKIAMFFILGFIILVASFNILGTLMLLITEKIRDIAVIISMGATRRGIMTIFLAVGVAIGILGTMSGVLLGTVSP